MIPTPRIVAQGPAGQTTASGPDWVADGVITRPVHVVCSPYKTGTTSVGKALVRLGVGQRDMGHDRDLLRAIRPELRDLNRAALQASSFRAFARDHGAEVRTRMAGLVRAIAPYEIFHDAPFGHGQMHVFLRKVLAPEARFIWVNRDEADWLRSVRHWEETHPETYPAHTEWARNPEARAEAKRRLWKQQHRQFKRIRRYDPAACLELDWSDLRDWSALAAFYGLAPPSEDFPCANVSATVARAG